ncbi:hypothetical protein D9M68_18340 [compost metagenome]
MNIQNAGIAVVLTAAGAGLWYMYNKYTKQQAELAHARAIVEPLLKDVPGFNKPSR